MGIVTILSDVIQASDLHDELLDDQPRNSVENEKNRPNKLIKEIEIE